MTPSTAPSPASPRLLNLGCGSRFHPAWVNVDFRVTGPGVLAHDLTRGLPFPEASFEAVYHSHLLEHFPKSAAPAFAAECLRVLAPGGILRVAVPDLETLARLYLKRLDKALAGDREAEAQYDWILLELFDQMVRVFPGGRLFRHLLQNPLPAESFILARSGSEAKDTLARLRDPANAAAVRAIPEMDERDLTPAEVGAFRAGGEVHQWMYDRFSLARLLSGAGFADLRVVTARESAIPGFAAFGLDVEPDGAVRKPDSLFMEGVRPHGPSPQ